MKIQRNSFKGYFSIAGSLSGLLIFCVIIVTQLVIGLSSGYAGVFVLAGKEFGVDVVTHPTGYTGTGGVLTVGVCIDPTSENTKDMEIPIQNIVNTFNSQVVTTDNLKTGESNDIPENFFDFESVALHELGHCIGLAHVNVNSESSLPDNRTNYTNTTNGADNVFNVAPGADSVIGSSDDIRGDDINLHWFNNALNNPFKLMTPVDSTTYSRAIVNLPAGHEFATNADRDVSSLLGVRNSEAIMQQGVGIDEAQRTLVADDVATLRYAMSGLDEIAGNADDYTLNLKYLGVASGAGCDITIKMLEMNAFAFCSPRGLAIDGGNHIRISSASISIDAGETGPNWYFNKVRNASTAEASPGGSGGGGSLHFMAIVVLVLLYLIYFGFFRRKQT